MRGFWNVVLRNVNASWIFSEVVARERERAGAGATADVHVLAGAAFALPQVRIAQNAEELGVAVDVHEGVAADVACREREESAREHLTLVRHEDEAAAIAD